MQRGTESELAQVAVTNKGSSLFHYLSERLKENNQINELGAL